MSEEPLKKVTLNLYLNDVAWLHNYYGYGWSERVREFIRARIKEVKGTHEVDINGQ